jgi:ParB-like chromosome segregation protein Spo0J
MNEPIQTQYIDSADGKITIEIINGYHRFAAAQTAGIPIICIINPKKGDVENED